MKNLKKSDAIFATIPLLEVFDDTTIVSHCYDLLNDDQPAFEEPDKSLTRPTLQIVQVNLEPRWLECVYHITS